MPDFIIPCALNHTLQKAELRRIITVVNNRSILTLYSCMAHLCKAVCLYIYTHEYP